MTQQASTGGDAEMAAAARHLTETVATRLPVDHLPRFKMLLKRFFSGRWNESDADELSAIVAPHLPAGSRWEHALPDGSALRHGLAGDRYTIEIVGGRHGEAWLFGRAFSGQIRPEPTPHPRKVRFVFGGEPAPGVWFLSGEQADDPRAARMLADPDIADVMVAGDFVTVGLEPGATWEGTLDRILALVAVLFSPGSPSRGTKSREEMLADAARAGSTGELHLADPDEVAGRARLMAALAGGDTAERKVAVALLGESQEPGIREQAVRRGFADRSASVRRVAIDAARDEAVRDVLESALLASDPWIRWRALRNLSDLGVAGSAHHVAGLTDDPDFQVRFEVARITATEEDR